jgi:hypothetical protein
VSAAVALEQQLIDDVGSFTHDPLGFVNYAYDWGKGELTGLEGPREWQAEALDEIGQALRDPERRHQPILLARASGHGIGKSAFFGMLVNWGMSTCEDCRIVVTANTETQLRTKTSPEIGKWFRLSITSGWFDVQALSISAKEKDHSKSWRTDLVAWSETNTEAFAGLHNKGKRIIVLYDEASAISDKIWEVTEGALTDEDTEIIWVCFGNPTRNSGRFFDAFNRMRHRWLARQIDSRTVPGTNKTQIAKWIEDYGEDSDFVRIRVRGLFPSASAKQFIATSLVEASRKRVLVPNSQDHAAKILTLDPAWSGDEYVIGLRQGLFYKTLKTYRQVQDDVWLAKQLADFEDAQGADAVFIDFGYGTGVKSVGDSWGRNWQLVSFGGASSDAQMLNKRGEMYNAGKKWLEEGGVVEDDQILCDEIAGPEFRVRLDGKIVIESKEDMKARGLASPNRADAWVLSFAAPVLPKSMAGRQQQQTTGASEYDPYRSLG